MSPIPDPEIAALQSSQQQPSPPAETKSDEAEPDLSESEIDSYIISIPEPEQKQLKPNTPQKRETKDLHKRKDSAISTPTKAIASNEAMSPGGDDPPSARGGSKSKQRTDEFTTPTKRRVGWLGYGGREWLIGEGSPTKCKS